jgi:hypothetical protein
MYSAVIPSYHSKEKEGNKETQQDEEVINADDPRNKDMVKKILFG